MNPLTSKQLAKKIKTQLGEYEPFIYAVSKDGKSYYIHFNKLPNGMTHKLRISDHDEREKYGYKWQLRADGIDAIAHRKPYSLYFFDVDTLIQRFKLYYEKINAINCTN